MAGQVNYYEVLGVPRSASQSEIRSAYRRLAKERHPDHPGGSQEKFSLLQEAHAVLSDPNQRRKHDENLDLAYAEDQLSGLDFSSLEDELSAYREQREGGAGGPGLGERLRNKFRRKEGSSRGERSSSRGSGRDEGGVRRRGRYEVREARWHEPHYFEPEPVSWKSGTISFLASFLAFIAVGQLGLWATGISDPGPLTWTASLAPFMPILYVLVGLVAAYFSFRSAGYIAVALVFLSALVVGGRGGPEGLLQFGVFGIAALLLWIYLGNRRAQTSRERSR